MLPELGTPDKPIHAAAVLFPMNPTQTMRFVLLAVLSSSSLLPRPKAPRSPVGRSTAGDRQLLRAGEQHAQTMTTLANVQAVQYNAVNVYITATGIPDYPTGPFLDGNPSLAGDNGYIFHPARPATRFGHLRWNHRWATSVC